MTSSMVIDVYLHIKGCGDVRKKGRTSATFVAAMIFHEVFDGSKILLCSLVDKLACNGRTIASLWLTVFRIASIHCLISPTPGRNIKIPPFFSAVCMI